ncbi:MAG: TolC family protein [Saprospiraceae bacterium]|jgi:outer membrane protein TolC
MNDWNFHVKAMVLFLAIFCKSILLHAQTALSVKESVAFAVKNSPQILKSRLETLKNEEKIKEYKSSGLPQVNFSTNLVYNLKLPTQLIPNFFEGKPEELVPVQFGTDMSVLSGVELNQLAYSQTYWTGLKAARELSLLDRLVESKTQEELVYNVVRTYYQAKVLDQQKGLVRANLEQVVALLRLTELQYQNGFAKKVDVDQLRVNKVSLETQLQNLGLQYEQLLHALKLAMAMPFEQEIVLADTLLADPAALAGAPPEHTPSVSNKLDLAILDKQATLQQLSVDVYRAGYFPSLRLFAGYNFQGQGNRLGDFGDSKSWFNFSQVGLNLSVPIFDGFLKKSQIQQGNIELLKIAEDRRQLQQNLEFQYGNARRQLQSTWNSLSVLKENQQVAEEIYQVTRKRFEQGVASITEVLTAERTMREVQSSYLATVLQYNLALIDLAYANGNILQLFN